MKKRKEISSELLFYITMPSLIVLNTLDIDNLYLIIGYLIIFFATIISYKKLKKREKILLSKHGDDYEVEDVSFTKDNRSSTIVRDACPKAIYSNV